MRYNCEQCRKAIELFEEFWLREPAQFDTEGVEVVRGKSYPFCSLGCVFTWSGRKSQKRFKPSSS